MPKVRVPAVRGANPVRVSTRKRKHTDDSVDNQAPAHDKLNSTIHPEEEPASKPAKRGRVKTIKKPSDALPDEAPLENAASPTQDAGEIDVKLGDKASVATAKHTTKRKRIEHAPTAKIDGITETKVESTGKSKVKSASQQVVVKEDGDEKSKQTVRKRKTKEEKEAESMPLAARSNGLKMFVGAHVSIAKGLENAITNCMHIGGNAFALFLKSQRKWENPALKDENRDLFKQHCDHHNYDQSSHVVPHGSYLVNLASPDKDMSKKSYDAFLDDLRRCEALGIKYYNFHPGSTNKEPLNEAIGRLANNLNRALAATSTVTPLLENMAGHGSIIGSRFSDLRDIIAAIKPEFKSRIGICIDTCHTFAAGYDLRSEDAYSKTFQELDEVVGLKYLKAMHINDSKAPFNSHRDLHQNIGAGFLGLRAFHNVMNDVRLHNIPLILETPCDKPDPTNPKKTIDDKNVWAREIKLLESLIGMDPESEEFKRLEAELSEQGQEEREKMEKSIAARDEKAEKKAKKEREKNQKSISAMFGGKGKTRKPSVSSSSSLSGFGSEA